MEIFSQTMGWAGTVCVVLAYFLLVYYDEITEDSRIYQVLNFFGAALLAVSLFYKTAWPAFTLQMVWGMIAIFSLLRKKK